MADDDEAFFVDPVSWRMTKHVECNSSASSLLVHIATRAAVEDLCDVAGYQPALEELVGGIYLLNELISRNAKELNRNLLRDFAHPCPTANMDRLAPGPRTPILYKSEYKKKTSETVHNETYASVLCSTELICLIMDNPSFMPGSTLG